MVDGMKMFWEMNKYTAGGRKIELVTADTTCNPDQALTQARRLALQEKVHFLIGPLCGHEGPAVAQVSKETGIPLVLDPAGADTNTKWDRTPSVVRTAVSASQISHPFGDYLYKELGARNATFIGSDYTWGHEVAGGMIRTYKELGGKVNKVIWAPLATTDYGASLAAIPADSDAVVVALAGVARIRFFEAWYNFGYDKKFKLHGGYWLHEDAIPQIDARAVGLISNSVHYVAGIDTPENKAFVDDYARRYKKLPSWFATPRACGPRRRSTRSMATSKTAPPSSRPCAPCKSRPRAARSSSMPTTTRSKTSTSRVFRRSSTRSWAMS
jgi:branched-chain amino acid transport system substrate-binding protein